MSSCNFCPMCGNPLAPDARFCGECGTPIDSNDANADSSVPSTSGWPDPAQAIELTQGTQAAPMSTPSIVAETPTEKGNDAPAQTLTAAVESTKRRSRRHVPFIVLVALALALTSAIAFAAYTVYTQVIAPAMQEQQANNALESDNASQANTTSEGDASSQDSQATISTEEAQAAYQVVIDDYKSAIAEYAAAGSTSDKDAFSEKHPPIFRDRNIDSCLDASRGTLSYSFATFKEGEPPVLLIKSAQGSTSEDANSVQLVAAYVLVNNEPTIAVEKGHDGSSLTLINGKMLRWFTRGAGQTGKSVKQNLYFSVSTTSNDNQNREVKSNPSTGWEGKMTSSSIEEVSVFTKAPSCINVIGLITSPMATESTEITVTHPDGSTTTSSEGSEQAEQSLETECLNACEQSLNLSWQPLA